MPRRSTAAQPLIQPTTSAPASENLALLRKQWKWAAFCQFFCTFAPLFAMNDVSISDIELDLVEGTGRVVPRIMTRLLYTLTYDRKASIDNWQFILRMQYAKRAPDLNPLGTEPLRTSSPLNIDKTCVDDNPFQLELMEESSTRILEKDSTTQPGCVSTRNNGPSDWFKLSLIQKLDTMHLLTEWHFQHPMRLRSLMKSDDDDASWRIEPIGYDKQANAYWLIGSDRLWIQRPPPKPQTKGKQTRRGDEGLRVNSSICSKRRRLEKDLERDSPISLIIRSKTKQRAAKSQAKDKLQRAEVNSEVARTRQLRDIKVTSRSKPGSRVSARLRGAGQSVHGDWMEEFLDRTHFDLHPVHTTSLRTGLESDSDDMSELTELSEESCDVQPKADEMPTFCDPMVEQKAQSVESLSDNVQTQKNFVEWETICVTLRDWEHISYRFASGTHYTEKALHKYLVNHLVPNVTEQLKMAERQKRLDDAMTYRKRSSRIALKESEKEQALAAARMRVEEQERSSRAMRLEARQQRMRQENGGRQRKERVSREASWERNAQEEQCDDPDTNRESQPTSIHLFNATNPPGVEELECEICHKHDIRPVDNTVIVCSSCSKWQHVACHDEANQRAGLPKHGWDGVDFICQSCRRKADVGYRPIKPEIVSHGLNEPPELISQTGVSILGQSTLPAGNSFPGPHSKHQTLHNFMWGSSLVSPAGTQPSNAVEVQNTSMSLQDHTTTNAPFEQSRWNVPLITQTPFYQPGPDNQFDLQRGEYRERTSQKHSFIFAYS